jgi:ABC-type uncharacterized transport system substrate-binding protein
MLKLTLRLVAPKRLQLLHELIPNVVVFGVIEDPTVRAYPSITADLQAAALALGLQLIVVNASSDSDVETVHSVLASAPDGMSSMEIASAAGLRGRNAADLLAGT